MTHFILASSQACIGCRTCEVACALEHVAEGAEFHPRLKVMRLDTLSVPVMCHQCEKRAMRRGLSDRRIGDGRRTGRGRCRALYWLPELCRRLPIWRDYYRNIGGASAGYCEVRSLRAARRWPGLRIGVPNGGNIADDR